MPTLRSVSLSLLLLALLSAAARPAHGAAPDVRIARGAGDEVELSWTGGIGDFRVYRSASTEAIEDPANLIATVPASPYLDTPPAGGPWFYAVASDPATCDPDGVYWLDAPLDLSCETTNGPYIVHIESFRISQNGNKVDAEPLPSPYVAMGPTACPSGSFGKGIWIEIFFEQILFLSLSAAFTGPDVIAGTLDIGPSDCGPWQCPPYSCTLSGAPFTARR